MIKERKRDRNHSAWRKTILSRRDLYHHLNKNQWAKIVQKVVHSVLKKQLAK